ncbi:MAG: hypothetical protein CMJ49_07590 [Planctomycetaceae bacterium]|nr:hypothetical protein [Planctomycetaceae bacterium]
MNATLRATSHALPFTALGLIVLCWAELGYRFHLYHHLYDAAPFMNHVADHYFHKMYTFVAFTMLLSIAGIVFAVYRPSRLRALICAGAIALAVGYIITLADAHQRNIIVTYHQWAEVYGP